MTRGDEVFLFFVVVALLVIIVWNGVDIKTLQGQVESLGSALESMVE